MGLLSATILAMFGALASGAIDVVVWTITGQWPAMGFESWQNRLTITLIIAGAFIGLLMPEQ